MAINQVYPPDWELTRAGDKAARSVANAKRGLTEMAAHYDMRPSELRQYSVKSLQANLENRYGYKPTPHAIVKALSELETA